MRDARAQGDTGTAASRREGDSRAPSTVEPTRFSAGPTAMTRLEDLKRVDSLLGVLEQRVSGARRLAALTGLLLCGFGAQAEHYTVPLFVSAFSSDAAQGRLRIVNPTDESGTVEINAIDDAGARFGPATVALNAWAAVEFEPLDLSSGNAAKGLSNGLGIGHGHFRLELDADAPIVHLAYVRAPDGTLSAMHDTVRAASRDTSDRYRYEVPVFNPASELVLASRLRLINPGDAAATVTIVARDDGGAVATGGSVTFSLAAGGARTLTAQQLEAGDTAITGQLGAGTGKWRLTVTSDRALQVVNIVAATSGYWSNLSTTAAAGTAPGDLAAFNARLVGQAVVYETRSDRATLNALARERFTETVVSDGFTMTHAGGYGYAAIGPDAGRLTLTYDDGDVCRANMNFSTPDAGWFASHCTGSDYPAEGTWLGGDWSVQDDDNVDGEVPDTTAGANGMLPGVPTSGFFVPAALSEGRVSSTTAGTTIDLDNGGYFELDDGTRYTCVADDGCAVENGTVTRGTVAGRPAGDSGGEVDRFPTFRGVAGPGNRRYAVGTEIDALVLPEASTGNGTLTYRLTPEVPGLSFDAIARRLTGTPSAAGDYAMTYTATDTDDDSDTLHFTISVVGAVSDGDAAELFDLHDDNGNGGGIAYADGRFHVVDGFDDKVYAYTGTGQHDPGSDFDLHDDNSSPDGIVYAHGRFYVVDGFDEKVYAYTDTGQHDAGSDFDLHDDNGRAEGIAYGDGRFYVVDRVDEKAYAYTDTGQHDAAGDFDLHDDNRSPTGIVYADGQFYVVDWFDEEVYAYTDTGQHDAGSDFDLHDDNSSPDGIVYAHGRFYVVDGSEDKVYSYGGTERPDGGGTSPSFAEGSGPGDRTYMAGTAIDALTLPAASGGDGTLTYNLSPDVPGLTFDAVTRRLSGTPSAVARYDMTYTATDEDGDTATLEFAIVVEESTDGGDVTASYAVDEALPGVPTSGFFVPAVLSEGRVSSTTAGTTIDLDSGGYFELDDGTRYTCVADDGCAVENGTVTRGTVAGRPAGDSGGEVDRFPTFRDVAGAGNRRYAVGTEIDALVLPEASSGNGTLTYRLTPEVPGLSFDAIARRLTGTPSAAGDYAMTYTATDTDDDSDTLHFTISVVGAVSDGDAAELFDLHDDGKIWGGIAYGDGRFYVVDRVDDKAYAYTDTGQHDAGSDFDLHDDNGGAEGIAYGGGRFYVVDEFDEKVYAYTDTGQHDAAGDFDLHDDNGGAEGIAYGGGRFYVVDWFDEKVYAYTDTGQHDAAGDFYLQGDNHGPTGIVYADGRFYVVDWFTDKVYAYTDTGQRDAGSDFELHDDNRSPKGIVYADGRFYVVDGFEDKAYSYGGTEPPDGGGTSPSFAEGSGPGDRTYMAGTAIDTLTLPAASGGDGTLTYNLSPDVPGLTFDAVTRRLTGTPSAVARYDMTYTATDEDGDTATLDFAIVLEGSADGGDVTANYAVEEALPGVPTSGFFVPAVASGASLGSSSAGTTITLDSGGYFELDDGTRYTCVADDGCAVENGTVTQGTMVGASAGSQALAPADEAAFNSRAVGRRLHAGAYYIEFESGARFTESGSFTGSYRYESTGPGSGTLTLRYEGGQYGGTCRLDLGYGSATTGTVIHNCYSGLQGLNAWTITANDVPPAPRVAPVGGTDSQLRVEFLATLESGQTRAYDYQVRDEAAGEAWRTSCGTLTNDASNAVTARVREDVAGLDPETLYEVRYRFRNASSCDTGVPGTWSLIGESSTHEAGTGQALEFSESSPATRWIPENLPGGINVGDPVSAPGAAMTYSLGGADAGSFDIVADTGQVRTVDDVSYDYETKNRYRVEVTVADDAGNRESIDVTIDLLDRVPVCNSTDDLGLRTHSADGRLTVRWNALPDTAGLARVLGYQTEIKRGDTGAWTDRRTFLGRSIAGAIYAGLDNGIGYQVRVRAVNAEADCGWSTPVSGIPTGDLAPRNDIEHLERFGPHPIGTEERNFRLYTPGRCRRTVDGVSLDADCRYERTSPNAGRITLEFDDPSRGSCDVALAYSSLTAGSFVDECFDAGVNTNVPYDRSFMMPPLAPRTEGDLDPPPTETVPQRAPRDQAELDAFVFGRDDFIPGLCFGRCLLGDAPERGVARVFHFDNEHTYGEHYGDYTYENTGPSQGVVKLRMRGGGTWTITLDFEPWGNVRATIVDDEGGTTVWPGTDYVDLTLGAQPILLPIPPSWSAAIAIESDYASMESVAVAVRDELRDRFFPDFHALISGSDNQAGRGDLQLHQDIIGVGRNRFVYVIGFPWTDPDTIYGRNEAETNRKLDLNGSEWTFVVTLTSDGAAEVSFTATKEGNLPLSGGGFVDFTGGGIDLEEFPDELQLPDEVPQASGEDVSGVEVASTISAERIDVDDTQIFLVNASGADFQPGDWLEPKDGGNQRMMIVGTGQDAAAAAPEVLRRVHSSSGGGGRLAALTPWFNAPIGTDRGGFKSRGELTPFTASATQSHGALYPQSTQALAPDSELIRLAVVCMQSDNDVPARGARYFSRAKVAEGPVQMCQKNCVLNAGTNIQSCVWACEENAPH